MYISIFCAKKKRNNNYIQYCNILLKYKLISITILQYYIIVIKVKKNKKVNIVSVVLLLRFDNIYIDEIKVLR